MMVSRWRLSYGALDVNRPESHAPFGLNLYPSVLKTRPMLRVVPRLFSVLRVSGLCPQTSESLFSSYLLWFHDACLADKLTHWA
jgi:hypothetical protein